MVTVPWSTAVIESPRIVERDRLIAGVVAHDGVGMATDDAAAGSWRRVRSEADELAGVVGVDEGA